MKHILSGAFLLCFLPLFASAQITFSVHGRITDLPGKPVPFVSISILRTGDTLLIQSTASDKNGHYHFDGIYAGSYLLSFSAVGYRNVSISAALNKVLPDTVYNVQLVQNEHELDGVTVVSRKPYVQVRANMIKLNVAASINATGSTVFDLLRKAPGIRTAGDESISIAGKNGLTVYIDGIKLNLSGKDLIDYLQGLNSSNIETIEIITNPPAKYEAEGNGGIVNIKTKKNTGLGFNGNLTLNSNFSNYKPKYSAAANLNYRQKKFNLYGSYSLLEGNYKNTQYLLKNQADNGTSTNFDQHYVNRYFRRTFTFKTGISFFISPKSTLGLMTDAARMYNDPVRSSITSIYQNPNKIDSQLVSKTLQPRHNNNNSYNINYQYRDSAGHELLITGDYGRYKYNSRAVLSNKYETDAGAPLSETNATFDAATQITIHSIKADYTQKAGKGDFSTGIKYSEVKSANDLLYYNVFNNLQLPDSGQTNRFSYREKIAAAYLNYTATIKKWELDFGTRLEHTASAGVLNSLSNQNLQAVDTGYFNFFPDFSVDYKLTAKHNIGLAYNRRIDRPTYQDLNPFKFVLDKLFYIQGNPFLRPQFTTEFKLSHTYKERFNTSLSYNNIKDYRLNFRDTTAGGVTHQSISNISRKQIVVLQTSAELPLQLWWSLFYDASIFHEKLNGFLGQSYLTMAQTSWEVSAANTFNLKHKWTVELSGYYNSKYVDAPAIVRAQWSIDAGVQKKIWDDAGTMRLSVSDIFNSLEFAVDRNFGGLFFINRNKWESRQLKLSFSYKFGKAKIKTSAQKTGVEDERNRIKSGQ